MPHGSSVASPGGIRRTDQRPFQGGTGSNGG